MIYFQLNFNKKYLTKKFFSECIIRQTFQPNLNIVMKHWYTSMFNFQIDSPQAQRNLKSCIINSIPELPFELPNDFRLRKLRDIITSGLLLKDGIFSILIKNSSKIENLWKMVRGALFGTFCSPYQIVSSKETCL